MTDYNNGDWWGWNGGDCPVHSESLVTVKWSCNGVEATEKARCFSIYWAGDAICAFRVVEEHKVPRTFWAVGKHLHDTLADAEAFCDALERDYPGNGYDDKSRIVKLAEVLE